MSPSHISNLWGKYCDYYHFTCEEGCWDSGTRWQPKLGVTSVRNEVFAIEHSSILPKCLEATVRQYWKDSVQFSSVAQSCPTLRPHEPQHTGPPCPSPAPRVHPNPCPLSRWCHPTISSSMTVPWKHKYLVDIVVIML